MKIVHFDTYKQFFYAYWWCDDYFGKSNERWWAVIGQTHRIFFKSDEDFVEFMLSYEPK